MAEPVYVSCEAFVSMEAAFRAGQARLAEFTPAQMSTPSSIESHLRIFWVKKGFPAEKHTFSFDG